MTPSRSVTRGEPDLPEWARKARARWRYIGGLRPDFAVAPAEGQVSVWDYPRPPRIEPEPREVVVRTRTTEIARSRRCVRVLETASPPTVYLPPDDVKADLLELSPERSRCEWKGEARYWTTRHSEIRDEPVAWTYPGPLRGYEQLRDWFSFYPSRLECYVDGTHVLPQPGRFYGGWVTPEVVGPFKGEPGSELW